MRLILISLSIFMVLESRTLSDVTAMLNTMDNKKATIEADKIRCWSTYNPNASEAWYIYNNMFREDEHNARHIEQQTDFVWGLVPANRQMTQFKILPIKEPPLGVKHIVMWKKMTIFQCKYGKEMLDYGIAAMTNAKTHVAYGFAHLANKPTYPHIESKFLGDVNAFQNWLNHLRFNLANY